MPIATGAGTDSYDVRPEVAALIVKPRRAVPLLAQPVPDFRQLARSAVLAAVSIFLRSCVSFPVPSGAFHIENLSWPIYFPFSNTALSQ